MVTHKDLFAGGRGPACWQRDFSRSIQKQGNLKRACNWVSETVKPSPLQLQRQPLWGTCLAELVNAPPPEAVEAQQGESVKRKGRQQTLNLDKKPIVAPTAKHKQKQAERATAVLANPPKVKPGFLQQLTKTTVQPKPTHSQTAENSPAAKRFIETTTSPDSKTAVTRHKPADKKSTQAWRKAVAGKASKRLTQSAMVDQPGTRSASNRSEAAKALPGNKQVSAATEPEFDSDVEHGKRPLADRPKPSNNTKNVIEAAWQQQLAGQSVSTNHLKALTTSSQQSSANHAKSTHTAANEAKLAGGNETEQNSSPANQLFQAKRPLPVSKQTAPAKPKALPQSTRLQSKSQQLPAFGQTQAFAAWDALNNQETGHRSNEPHVAPPQMAAKLPPLQAQQNPATPEMPLATAVVHQSVHKSTRAEADADPENLAALAVKIKQILDEESRRFGIDV